MKCQSKMWSVRSIRARAGCDPVPQAIATARSRAQYGEGICAKVAGVMADRGLQTLADFERIGAADVEAHLTDLAVDGDVAPSTQDQAFYALLFRSEHVLKREFGSINAIRSDYAPRIPTVMSKSEVIEVLARSGTYLATAQLLYGCMRIMNACGYESKISIWISC
ncbi:MAG: hypothetical protein R3C53_02835 [Pirellulaceae bacterium]